MLWSAAGQTPEGAAGARSSWVDGRMLPAGRLDFVLLSVKDEVGPGPRFCHSQIAVIFRGFPSVWPSSRLWPFQDLH